MIGSKDEKLKKDLKQLIIEECEKEPLTPEDITDDVVLFSNKSKLNLDSIDALQISMELKNRYKIQLTDSKAFRRHLKTINNLADFIQPE